MRSEDVLGTFNRVVIQTAIKQRSLYALFFIFAYSSLGWDSGLFYIIVRSVDRA